MERSSFDNHYVGKSECDHIFEVRGNWNVFLIGDVPVISGVYYICGGHDYFTLPRGWYSTSYLGIVYPKIYRVKHLIDPVWETKSRSK